jgi:hypothetical protein
VGRQAAADGRDGLQVHHAQLRKALGRDLIVTRAPGDLIRVADGELGLDCFEQTVIRTAPRPRARPPRGFGRRSPPAVFCSPMMTLRLRAARARLEEQRLRPAGAGAPLPPSSR